jgi:hypothetical protein
MKEECHISKRQRYDRGEFSPEEKNELERMDTEDVTCNFQEDKGQDALCQIRYILGHIFEDIDSIIDGIRNDK